MTRSNLSWLNDGDLQALKSRVQKQELRSCHASFDAAIWQGAFKATKFDVYYLVVDDIIYLLPEFALQKQNVLRLAEHDNDMTKQSVKQFYDSFGWQQESGIFQDALDSEDLREVSRDYIEQCHARLKQHLPATGRYLLDVASGPIQYDAYLAYSENYHYRLCADISLRALQAAKQKLGAKGIYLLSDVTRLPLQTGKIDAAISLHTLYHVPKEQQLQGYTEIQRVLKPKGSSVVIYSWGRRALLMNVLMFPVKLWSLLKRLQRTKQTGQTLYFYAHSYEWYRRHIQRQYDCKLYSWRSVNVPFLKLFIHRKFGGRMLLKAFFWLENRFPQLMGRIGAYPLFVSTKP
ncbi:class I SAM-dependent methyltransferase [Candidatus Berkiella aquae]|uniref:Class I SAM-dependent methyltransferase n=1 Tax=Candidatus Berkiella aquae TaxID=295108 RepID=A0AAE3L9U5_9GAMM|nr:class I SAM-dependent methyltransferase [Candidatus Berkiella aquae]MCS5712290.1 class I SAM-dependent methyltransferase [Candidatus Berkiella aquae]